jgi:L-fuculose-phosphate aldolase
MAVTPSGIPYADLREEMIVVVDLETGEWNGSWKPTSERKIHREIYRRRPEVGAVVHTHQNAASACAAARVSVPVPWGQVPCAAYALPGTKALTRAVVRALGTSTAVLLANHGVFVVGVGMNEAFERILALETACADYLEAKAVQPLPARADASWKPNWLSPLPLVDGFPALLCEAPFTLAWSERGEPLKAVLDDLAQLVGTCVPAAQSFPERRPKNDALFVKDKGLVVCGTDAEALAMVVEKAARAALGGESIGDAVPIPVLEARLMRLVYKNSYAKQAAKTATLAKR